VELLRHPPRFLDDLREGDHLDVAVSTDRYHPAPAGRDQLHRLDAEAGGPEPVRRRGRAAALEMPEHGHPRLESSLALDAAGQQVADAALREPDMTERVLLGLASRLAVELRDVGALGHHDDAEQLPVATAAV